MARFGHAASAVALILALSSSALADDVTSYTYDVHGRLKRVTRPTSTTDYTYDNAQNRTRLTTVMASGNHAPVANVDNITVAAGGTYPFNPLANDSDADSDTFYLTGASGSAQNKGTVTPVNGCLNTAATCVTYVSTGDTGSDSFTYTIADGKGGTAQGTVNVTINAAVSPPVANNFTTSVAGNSPAAALPLSITGGTPTSVSLYSVPANATATPSGTNINFKPDTGWSGQTSLQYTATNSLGTSQPANATINVKPVVSDVTGQTAVPGQPKTLALAPYAKTSGISAMNLLNGLDTQLGKAVINGTTLTYTPNFGATGYDTFAYQATGPGGTSAPANITFAVQACQVGTAGPASLTVAYNSTHNLVPLNISGAVASTEATTPSHGTLEKVGPSYYYTPTPNYVGPDSFTYVGQLPCGSSSPGVVDITVLPRANSAPRAADDYVTLPYQGGQVNWSINDEDYDGDFLVISDWTNGAHGTVYLSGETVLTYFPDAGFTGSDQFQYSVSDGYGGSSQATVHVTIQPPPTNQPPTANNDSYSIAYNEVLEFNPLLNDSDPDGDTLSITSITMPKIGYYRKENQLYYYGVNYGYTGTESFNYTVSDGHGHSATGTISITVVPAPGNHAPVAVDDSLTMSANGAENAYVRANDTDADGDLLQVTEINGQKATYNGNLATYSFDGDAILVEAHGIAGTERVSYTVRDGRGGVATAYLRVHFETD